MIKVRPDLDEWFSVVGIRVGYQKIKPEFNVTYVFQQSTWLIVMLVNINGEKHCKTEYSDNPIIDNALIAKFCYELETQINAPIENSKDWYMERNNNRGCFNEC